MNNELKSKAARGFAWGMLNNGTLQVLGALFGILLLRRLGTEDYGKITMLMIFASLGTILQESGFIAALCNLKERTHRDFNAVFWCQVGIGTVLYIGLFLAAPLIARFYHDPSFLWLSRVLFLGFFFSSLGSAQRAYLFVNLMNRETCLISITSLLFSNIVAVSMAYAGCGYWSMAALNVLYILGVTVMSWWVSPWRPTFTFDLQPAWRMFGFSSKLLLTNAVNSVSSNIFPLLLGRYYTAHHAGIYGNARKWNDMCANSINGMLTGVAQPVLSQVVGDADRYKRVFRKMLRFVSFVSFPSMLGMGLVAHEFILLLVGEKWEESSRMLSMLSIYGAFFPLTTLFSQLAISQGRSNINMWCTIVLSAFILSGLILFHPYGIYAMLVYFICVNLAWLLVWQYFAWRLIGLTLWQTLHDVLPFLIISVAVLAFTWWATRGIENLIVLLASKILLASSLYFLILYLSKAKILREALHFVLHRIATPDESNESPTKQS